MPHERKRRTVYLETTIVSMLVSRPSPDPLAAERQRVSRAWWERRAPDFDLRVSPLVLEEAGRGDPEAAARRLAFLEGLQELSGSPAVTALASALLAKGTVPATRTGDAFHVAFCAVHGVDILLTWNCRHIANPLKRPEIEAVCRHNGYEPPRILTPTEALAEESHGRDP